MLVHHKVSPPSISSGFLNNSPVPIIYTPEWGEALWEESILHKDTTQWPGQVLNPDPWNPDPLTGVQHTEHLAPVIPQAFMPGYLSFLEDITFLKVFTVDFVWRRRRRWTKRKVAISRFLMYKTVKKVSISVTFSLTQPPFCECGILYYHPFFAPHLTLYQSSPFQAVTGNLLPFKIAWNSWKFTM